VLYDFVVAVDPTNWTLETPNELTVEAVEHALA
jgi:hypothetical protein